MQTLTMADDALDIVKSSMNLKRRILKSNYDGYKNRLRAFEAKYRMSSKQFIKKYNSGQLGDDQKWFDWLFVYEAFSEINRELSLLRQLRI